MTFNSLILWAKREFDFSDISFIASAINLLEKRLETEVFTPAGKSCPQRLLTESSKKEELLLPKEFYNLYTAYTAMIICAQRCDGQMATFYQALFEDILGRIKVYYRKSFLPPKNIELGGGI